MTDDQASFARELRVMPNVRHLIAAQGTSFSRFYTSFPLCCPSRTTFLTGQFAHNTHVQGNFPDTDGGGYIQLTDPERTLPVWLHQAGYWTGVVGKWAEIPPPGTPPGWDRWQITTQSTIAHYYDFTAHTGGERTRTYGSADRDYNTTVLTRVATKAIANRAPSKSPFFLYVPYTAPHFGLGRDDAASRRCKDVPGGGRVAGQTALPAAQDAHAFEHARLPHPPSYDEPDISDKPSFEQRPRLKAKDIAEEKVDNGCRLASLLAVDRSVASIVRALKDAGVLDNTLIVYTSDNGFLLGQHREAVGKNLPYEEAIRVPLLIRGPGIPAAKEISSPTVNADLAPTILDAAGVTEAKDVRRPADGESLLPLAAGKVSEPDRAILIEGRNDAGERNGGGYGALSYVGVRTARYLYVDWHRLDTDTEAAAAAAPIGSGPVVGSELYDMASDPYQLDNLAGSAAYAKPRRALAAELGKLHDCSGESCKADAAIPPPAG